MKWLAIIIEIAATNGLRLKDFLIIQNKKLTNSFYRL